MENRRNIEHYNVRHVGKNEEVPVYRMLDEEGKDVFLFGKHPIELMIVTKDMFEGWLSGKYEWGDKNYPEYKPFSELAKEFKALKETKDIEKMRLEHVR
ncbi:MAG: hypothetical protein EU547_04995 [Promethearchaeota archaeon]|nr:MAG: hypothetical protein EU547_04995 [Candidatus Lokiarchaeota archaeon]